MRSEEIEEAFNNIEMIEHLSNQDINITGVCHDFQKTCGHKKGRRENQILKLKYNLLNSQALKGIILIKL